MNGMRWIPKAVEKSKFNLKKKKKTRRVRPKQTERLHERTPIDTQSKLFRRYVRRVASRYVVVGVVGRLN
jgi:hypothetical protein